MIPDSQLRPSALVRAYRNELIRTARLGPVLDVACGDGRNGLYLAAQGARVLMVDRSQESLEQGVTLRRDIEMQNSRDLCVAFARLDLETAEPPAFARESLGVVLVLRFLHRPLVPVLKEALKPGGIFLYETYLEGHQALGKPTNPSHLLARGELKLWFTDWQVIHHFEGRMEDPPRLMGQILCVKPGAIASQAAS
jgi:tellurite methyltransferase